MARVTPIRRPARRAAARPTHAAPASRPIGCALITVSDTRMRSNDPGGDGLARAIEASGHRVARRTWVADEVRSIRFVARAALGDRRVDVVVLTGGTGLAPRGGTP